VKRLLLVGSVGCGKTTLLQRLSGVDLEYAKTESIALHGRIMDTPGEYLEVPGFKHALRMASFEVDLCVLLASATVLEAKFPPGFTSFFMPPCIGVVTKTDLGTPRQVSTAQDHLRLAGVTEFFAVSAVTGDGMEPLTERLS
jgi:ethanolamine utilization protein EutP